MRRAYVCGEPMKWRALDMHGETMKEARAVHDFLSCMYDLVFTFVSTELHGTRYIQSNFHESAIITVH